jgi:DNA-binding IclR family transcriptional regulator
MAEKQRSIQSIEIGGKLLQVLSSQSHPMILKDLAEKAGMTASKAHPYLVSFMNLGFIEQNSETGQYQLGSAALQLGLSCLKQLDPLKIATPIVEVLAQQIQQSVAIAVWGNLGPTVVRMIESNQPIHVNMRTGTVMSATGTATGKVFAAFMPMEKLDALHRLALGDRVSHGQTREKIDTGLDPQELELIRQNKMAQSISKPIPGVSALSAAVFDHSGQLSLVITALGPDQTFDARLDGLVAENLRKAAINISERLGFSQKTI